jgi:hypothetical protein
MSAWTDFLDKVKAQNFGPDDSQVVSSLVHPARGLGKFGEFLQQQVSQAAGMPQNQDEASMYSYGPSQEQQAAAANNLTGMMQTGAMPFAPRSAGGTLGTFIGPKSAGWNPEAAAQATKLLDAGADPVQVWKQHLIGRMPDKSMFSEIDDSGAQSIPNQNWSWGNREDYKRGNNAQGALSEFFTHEPLAKEYDGFFDFGGPNDRRLGTYIRRGGGDSGSYNDGNITVGGVESLNGEAKANKSVMLHELQHAIQDREGWARGGNPTDINLDEFAPLRQKEYNDIGNVLLPDTMTRYKAATSQAEKDAILAERKALMTRRQQMTKQTPDEISFELYKRLTGEAQARATQDRMNMNMEQRRELYPLAGDKLSDIPLKDLINRYDSGIQSSVNKLPDTEFSRAHAAAQKNAALPVEQGGLGLPKDNTAMDRARAMQKQG